LRFGGPYSSPHPDPTPPRTPALPLLPPVPRVQIITIEELLAGKRLDYPNVAPGTFRRAPRQAKAKRGAGTQPPLVE